MSAQRPIISQATIVITHVEGGLHAYSAPLLPRGDETSYAIQLADRMLSLLAVMAQESGACDSVSATYHGSDPDLARAAQEVMKGRGEVDA
jgi:hypothetical protein